MRHGHCALWITTYKLEGEHQDRLHYSAILAYSPWNRKSGILEMVASPEHGNQVPLASRSFSPQDSYGSEIELTVKESTGPSYHQVGILTQTPWHASVDWVYTRSLESLLPLHKPRHWRSQHHGAGHPRLSYHSSLPTASLRILGTHSQE